MSAPAPWAALIAMGAATGLATAAGGVMALRFRSLLELFLGFSCGAVIGVALFDLLPEALRLAGPGGARAITSAVGAGFAIYLAADRLFLVGARPGRRGHMGPAALTVHSFMDGLGVGLAFQVSTAAGVVVAIGVLAHDLFDGINTVTLSLSGPGRRAARGWLAADSLAPLAGLAASRLILVPQPQLALLLGLFAGFFIYIGAGELLPRSQRERPRLTTMLATLAGLALIWVAVRLAGG